MRVEDRGGILGGRAGQVRGWWMLRCRGLVLRQLSWSKGCCEVGTISNLLCLK